MDYSYETLKALLNGKPTKKVDNNTYAVQWAPDEIRITLHEHSILAFKSSGEVVISDCGYQTHTTKARLNKFLQGQGFRIVQERFQWYLVSNDFYPAGREKAAQVSSNPIRAFHGSAVIKNGHILSPD